jgi:hypothetical protein
MSKHGNVIDELQHQYINKQDNYPSTPEDAMTMLSHCQDTTHKKKFHKEKEKSTDDEIGIANFAQQTQRNSTKKKSDTKDNNNSSISTSQTISQEYYQTQPCWLARLRQFCSAGNSRSVLGIGLLPLPPY